MLRLRFDRRRWDERGAVAVVVALMSLVIFAVAALAVDLGNGFARKRDTQAQADFAALAGARNLPAGSTVVSPGDQAVVDAAQYLEANQPSENATRYTVAELKVMLTDGSPANGEAYYGHFSSADHNQYLSANFIPSVNELTVVTPPSLVRYGLAKVLGVTSKSVRSTATVGLYSRAMSVFPAYAVDGCDQGPQTITDPANGHATVVVPTLSHASDSNGVTVAQPSTSNPNPSPSQVVINPSAGTIVLNGQGTSLSGVTQVGFFKEVTSGPPPEPVVVGGSNVVYDSSSKTVRVTIPIAGVTDAEQLWWIRVRESATGQWSAIQLNNGDVNTIAFRVGTPYLRCAGTSNQGNYGTLKEPRTDTTTANWLAYNIAMGLQSPMTMKAHPIPSPAFCDPSDSAPTIYSPSTGSPTAADLKPKTNCVTTDTGLTANDSTRGLLGETGLTGRLQDLNSAHNCSGRTRSISTGPSRTVTINDDILTCYLDAGKTVSDVTQDTYSGPKVISSAIYDSPRFFFQPVLGQKPDTGHSYYKVIDMRPAFLADQPMGATKDNPQVASDNGVVMDNNQVTQLNVIFLNAAAIKDPTTGPLTDYLGGTAPKIFRMTH